MPMLISLSTDANGELQWRNRWTDIPYPPGPLQLELEQAFKNECRANTETPIGFWVFQPYESHVDLARTLVRQEPEFINICLHMFVLGYGISQQQDYCEVDPVLLDLELQAHRERICQEALRGEKAQAIPPYLGWNPEEIFHQAHNKGYTVGFHRRSEWRQKKAA